MAFPENTAAGPCIKDWSKYTIPVNSETAELAKCGVDSKIMLFWDVGELV